VSIGVSISVGGGGTEVAPSVRRERLVARDGECLRVAALAQGRYLAEGQVFVEPARRQTFDRARHERNEGAAGWVRASCPTVDVHRHAATRAGVLEQAEVLLRR